MERIVPVNIMRQYYGFREYFQFFQIRRYLVLICITMSILSPIASWQKKICCPGIHKLTTVSMRNYNIKNLRNSMVTLKLLNRPAIGYLKTSNPIFPMSPRRLLLPNDLIIIGSYDVFVSIFDGCPAPLGIQTTFDTASCTQILDEASYILPVYS